MIATTTPSLELNNDVTIPALGFGVFQTPPDETRDAVRAALAAGYRHIDTAAAYGNERQVGEAVHSSELDRSRGRRALPAGIENRRHLEAALDEMRDLSRQAGEQILASKGRPFHGPARPRRRTTG
jgi:predicted aldo/keto reductase-like oxidoreductase